MFFFQTRGFKIGLTIFAAVAVILLVLFGRQIVDWIKLFGSKAEVTGPQVIFNGTDWAGGTHTGTKVDGNNLTIKLP
ncbi:hypothetical protein A3K24_01280 [candidate division Kazan bacterium RIFCSPHIGHO2_01_FULL_44_14]|uniref:Uncharacterized protein n=1 Tax=candidate division Kazan bacterium RIFCSPLOWO2_01_FULL_45_19 TaxID=1798538 RepID=A0A1F4NPT9_UNCK3|nr:hypothetical protein [uncultured bacterium]OGB73475.1 MAG: hypothetical protein A3K51_01280 [candidate division Kazan bacterium RIFCSPLOWO2_01_FULL_45_19]OGB77720.1 MAG: hypothetical protein A3K24_01280 [candidate division Kazan bacterium RIFCSPHIGHO2_01_FULL_44_14]